MELVGVLVVFDTGVVNFAKLCRVGGGLVVLTVDNFLASPGLTRVHHKQIIRSVLDLELGVIWVFLWVLLMVLGIL